MLGKGLVFFAMEKHYCKTIFVFLPLPTSKLCRCIVIKGPGPTDIALPLIVYVWASQEHPTNTELRNVKLGNPTTQITSLALKTKASDVRALAPAPHIP